MFAMFSEDSEQFVGWFLVPFGSFVSPGYLKLTRGWHINKSLVSFVISFFQFTRF